MKNTLLADWLAVVGYALAEPTGCASPVLHPGVATGMTATIGSPEFVYLNGALVPHEGTTIHGSSVAEKIRGERLRGGCALQPLFGHTRSAPSIVPFRRKPQF